ncbi:MAG: ABC transporter ATP-binding protein [Holophaga sp.]|nr:ABC transporter ATP-binding protein [Holophaga sp.]
MRLELSSLGKRFESGRWGLRGVNLVLEGPGLTILSGHNGSGKTLLARHILGLEQPDEGRILLDGADIRNDLRALRRRVAFVFQEPEHQILGMTVDEDVAWTPSRLGWPAARIQASRERAMALTDLAGRGAEPTAFLSGGEKRRLAVASVLAAEPELIILDEPFNDLDWPGVQALLAILIDLHRRGIALLVITHDLDKCLAHADRLVVMEAGAVKADGPVRELWDRLPELGLRRPGPDCGTLEGMTWLA